MYLKITKNNKTGRIHLAATHGYRDPKTKKVRSKTVQSFGYVDELKSEYEDPIAHFSKIVEEMNKEYNENKEITITISSLDRLNVNVKPMCLGYFPFSRIFHELEIDKFLRKYQYKSKIKYSLSKVLQLLIYCRILFPGSKIKAFEQQDIFFEKFNLSLDDIYRSLSVFNDIKDELQTHLYQKAQEKYGAKPNVLYYDVTNYYFELDKEDDLKKRGVSKEHKPEPIVQMGLMMDQDSIPIAYRLFPGNTNDCETFIPMICDLRNKLLAERVVFVSDKGVNTYKNMIACILSRNGYVFSQRIKKAHKELRDYVFDENGYKVYESGFKIKSRIYPKEVIVTDIRGKKKKIRIDEKQIVFYDPEYAKRARAEREEAVKKAYEMIANPAKYNKNTTYGAARFVNNLTFDADTGEIVTGRALSFNMEKLAEEECYDGYYSIVSSELDKSDDEIIDIYRGLWKIEESFKVTKTNLETRPVYVSREDHIEGHFLTCFVSLLFIRLFEKQIGREYSISTILESLRKYEVSLLNANFYKTIYYDKVLEHIGNIFKLTLNQNAVTQAQIKNFLARQKR